MAGTTMGVGSAIVFLIVVVIAIIVGLAAFQWTLGFVGGVPGFLVAILIALGAGYLAYCVMTRAWGEARRQTH